MARFSRFRRFSATPRRSWYRRRGFGSRPGTLSTKLQVCQFHTLLSFTMQESNTTPADPNFTVQSLTPWSNAPDGGFDRSWLLHGIVWDCALWPVSTIANGTTETVGLPTGSREYAPVCAYWFVDTFDPQSESPVAFLNTPRGPFFETPPVVGPGGADDADFPIRVLRRKYKLIRARVNSSTQENNVDQASLSGLQWSGTIRKSVPVDSRQALYFGFAGVAPASYATEGLDVNYQGLLSGCYYYKLRR